MGKTLAKRAKFVCEWCEGKDHLQPWEYVGTEEPSEENVALLCLNCRALAEGKKAEDHELRGIRNALRSPVRGVAVRCGTCFGRCKGQLGREPSKTA